MDDVEGDFVFVVCVVFGFDMFVLILMDLYGNVLEVLCDVVDLFMCYWMVLYEDWLNMKEWVVWNLFVCLWGLYGSDFLCCWLYMVWVLVLVLLLGEKISIWLEFVCSIYV